MTGARVTALHGLVAALLALTVRAAAASAPPPPPPPEYVIGPEDVIQISVWKNDTLSRTVPVRPDGKISLPLLNDVQAAGLTAMQLRDTLARELAQYLTNPEVSVIVSDVQSFRVSVLGEVQKPGVLRLGSTTTILEAIAMAGGLTERASPHRIVVVRRDAAGHTEKIPFNYNRTVSGAPGAPGSADTTNVVLRPGDVIVVP